MKEFSEFTFVAISLNGKRSLFDSVSEALNSKPMLLFGYNTLEKNRKKLLSSILFYDFEKKTLEETLNVNGWSLEILTKNYSFEYLGRVRPWRAKIKDPEGAYEVIVVEMQLWLWEVVLRFHNILSEYSVFNSHQNFNNHNKFVEMEDRIQRLVEENNELKKELFKLKGIRSV